MPDESAQVVESQSEASVADTASKIVEAELILVRPPELSPWEALSESQRLLAEELSDTQRQVTQLFHVLEQAVELLTVGMQRPGGGTTDAALAAGVARRLVELQVEMRTLRVAVEAARTDERIGDRVKGLYDTLREDLDREAEARDRSLRREIDRLLWILLGTGGLIFGGVLWSFLKP